MSWNGPNGWGPTSRRRCRARRVRRHRARRRTRSPRRSCRSTRVTVGSVERDRLPRRRLSGADVCGSDLMAVKPAFHRYGVGRAMLSTVGGISPESGRRVPPGEYPQRAHPDAGYAKTRAFWLACGLRRPLAEVSVRESVGELCPSSVRPDVLRFFRPGPWWHREEKHRERLPLTTDSSY
jgi:hypothetical protein